MNSFSVYDHDASDVTEGDIYGDYYRDKSGFSFADVIVYLGLPVGPLTVSPMVQLQFSIDDDFTDEEVFGIKASLVF